MDYSKWPVKSLKVNRLKLDPENPRLATTVSRPTQPTLIHELIEHEDVMDLVRDIAKQGYFPNELLVGCKEGANVTIVEGNRRLAALKLLDNPDLAEDPARKRIRTYLAKLSISPIKSVPVVMAPSREAAIPLIIARHKGNASVKRWTSVMQARFVQARLAAGLTFQEVAEEGGLSVGDVKKAFRNSKLSDVIQSLDLAAPVRKIAADPRAFNWTTLERLISTQQVRNELRMKFNDEDGFETTLPTDSFLETLAQIVSDVAMGDIDSRSINTKAQIDAYVTTLRKALGKKPAATSATKASDLVDPSKVPAPPPKKRKAAKKKAATRRSTALMPRTFRVDSDNFRIVAVSDELRRVNCERDPNAAALLFRLLLEMGLSSYLQKRGHMAAIKARMAKKKSAKQKPASWSPTLKQQLQHLTTDSTLPIPPEARKAIQKFLADTQTSLTLDTINGFAHNRYSPPTPAQLREFWHLLTPVLQMTLQTEEDET